MQVQISFFINYSYNLDASTKAEPTFINEPPWLDVPCCEPYAADVFNLRIERQAAFLLSDI